MIHPLVDYTYRSLKSAGSCNSVFRKHCKAKGVDHLWDAVIDLRIDVIRPACEDNTLHSLLFHLLQDLNALVADVFLEVEILFSTCFNGSFSFLK